MKLGFDLYFEMWKKGEYPSEKLCSSGESKNKI